MAPAWPAVCRTLFLALILFLSPIIAAPSSNHHALEARQSTSTEKMVFCHFMVRHLAKLVNLNSLDICVDWCISRPHIS